MTPIFRRQNGLSLDGRGECRAAVASGLQHQLGHSHVKRPVCGCGPTSCQQVNWCALPSIAIPLLALSPALSLRERARRTHCASEGFGV